MRRFKSKAEGAGGRDYELMSERPKPCLKPHVIVIKPHQIKVGAKVAPMRKTLRAKNEFWTETADLEMCGGIWRCVSGTGVLVRLVGMNQLDAKNELLRLGATWAWEEKCSS